MAADVEQVAALLFGAAEAAHARGILLKDQHAASALLGQQVPGRETRGPRPDDEYVQNVVG